MHLLLSIFSTNVAYAAPSTSLNGFIANVDSMIINPLILFLFALAVVYFLYGVLEFLMNQENEEKKTAGKSHMLWGVVGITIMLGVFTLMNIIINTFGIKDITPETGEVNLPQ